MTRREEIEEICGCCTGSGEGYDGYSFCNHCHGTGCVYPVINADGEEEELDEDTYDAYILALEGGEK